ncbi:hypothetical protein Leryth_003369 [Lithospermum erythrorhizon]|nr:hypothetical protein Leryth_003369 [Lithospermum erythrorhizon]
MATLRFLAFSSPISQCSQKPRSLPGTIFGIVHHGLQSSFSGQAPQLPALHLPTQRGKNTRNAIP